jgi:hypothetical protein
MTKARDLGDFISDGTIAETVTADGLNLGDNEKIQLGASQDLQIFHDGSNSYVQDSGSGSLIVTAADQMVVQKPDGTNRVADFHTTNGTVALKYQGSDRLATSATGATVTGTIAVSGDFNATSGTFTVQSNGTDILNVTSTLMSPQTDGAISLGSATNGFNNMYLDGSAYVSGNVGAGTSSPQRQIHSVDSNGQVLRLQRDGAFTGSWDVLVGSQSTGDFTIYDNENSQRAITVQKLTGFSGTSAMYIDSSGNVGIGTSSPTSYTGYSTIGLNSTNGGILEFKKGDTQMARIANAGGAFLQFVTNNAEAMRIDSSGNVGIGTDSPSSFTGYTNVTLKGGSNGSNLDFHNSSGTRVSAIVSNPGTDLIIETNEATPLKFKTNASEAMRIGTSGQIGLSGANYGTSGQVLTSGGSSAAPTWADAGGSGGLLSVQTFTSSGTYTIPSGATAVKVYTTGGGGGGGGYGGTPGGQGGTGGTSSVASGTESITTVSATGGAGAQGGGSSQSGGAGGTGSNGDINIRGQGGGGGSQDDTGGIGGGSFFGGGNRGQRSSSPNNVGFGGGGPGFFQSNNNGGGGGGGGTAIKFITGVTAGNTLTVTIGAGGTAGDGEYGDGGAGAAGVVYIEGYS